MRLTNPQSQLSTKTFAGLQANARLQSPSCEQAAGFGHHVSLCSECQNYRLCTFKNNVRCKQRILAKQTWSLGVIMITGLPSLSVNLAIYIFPVLYSSATCSCVNSRAYWQIVSQNKIYTKCTSYISYVLLNLVHCEAFTLA